MKRFVIFVVVLRFSLEVVALTTTGELVGVDGRKAYAEPDPFGMVAVPNGSFADGSQ
jgi:hypothetical protein